MPGNRRSPSPDLSTWWPAGQKVQQWLSDSEAPDCPILRTTLTLEHLLEELWEIGIIDAKRDPFHSWYPPIQVQLGTPQISWTAIHANVRTDIAGINFFAEYQLQSMITLGTIVIQVMYRKPNIVQRLESRNLRTPHIGEIIKATYGSVFPINSVRHVFVEQIQNRATMRCLWHIWGPLAQTEEWSPLSKTLTYGSYEFLAVLGSQVGKVVASFVLTAYGRGVKEVGEIFMFCFDEEYWSLRFDIRDI
ncbi:hypothetical protein N7456_011568 [Penicillium angulare]|uniref:Uncharacterized protein n=1 Tax=Penicillium angulare TaxID=116970 RepID=A0A9W9ETW9_9EURO|nr:hypothetical protein N7456_011568 [Penicillium angulare]